MLCCGSLSLISIADRLLGDSGSALHEHWGKRKACEDKFASAKVMI